MKTYIYNPEPCDEPPTPSLVAQAQRHADNTGEPVRIVDEQGRLFGIFESEV